MKIDIGIYMNDWIGLIHSPQPQILLQPVRTLPPPVYKAQGFKKPWAFVIRFSPK